MFSPLERLLAFRYLRSRRSEGFISVIAWFSFAGITLGVSTLIIVMSVMNGFRDQLVDSLSGVNGDITIYDSNKYKIKKIQEKNPSISFVENIQTRIITSNENGIEGLLMKSLNKDDIYKLSLIHI